MTKNDLPTILYLPGHKLGGGILHAQIKQEDGCFAIPVWGDKEKIFHWLREGGASTLAKLGDVAESEIIVQQLTVEKVWMIFGGSEFDRKVHYEPEIGNLLAIDDETVSL